MGDGTDVRDERADTSRSDEAPPTPLEWTAPGEALVPLRPGGSSYAGREVSSGWRVAAIIGLVIAGLLVTAVVLLWQKVDDLGDDFAQTRHRVTDARGLGGSVRALESSVEDLKGSVTALNDSTTTATADVTAALAALQQRTDALTACVNTYMDVLGTWTRNPGGSFVYNKC
jgi:hypothetical protein